jgi:15-cis-phytoene synthase
MTADCGGATLGTEQDDARLCAQIARHHARTFSIASLLLPLEERRAAFAIYGFCRVADDIVDTGDAPAEVRRRQLDAYRDRLVAALAGDPDDGVMRELVRAAERYRIPEGPLHELLDGVALDLDERSIHDWSDLERYCAGVASSVGELCAHIFCGRDGAHNIDQAIPYARHLGTAMQLTNILRDVGEDARLGRCYLPEDELNSFGLTRDRVLFVPTVARDDRWTEFMQLQVARARMVYKEARPGIALLAPESRRCATACASGYESILDAIEALDYDTVSTRARIGRMARMRVLWGAWRSDYDSAHLPARFQTVAPQLDVYGTANSEWCSPGAA